MCNWRIVLLFLAPSVFAFQPPPDPTWWQARGVISATTIVGNNYSPATVGQLKNFAAAASAQLEARLPGGAGAPILNLVNSWPKRGVATQAQLDQNYAPVTLGQLKSVAKLFYDRLHAEWYNTTMNLVQRGFPVEWPYDYPWNPSTPVSENYSVATVGQLKMIFSFDPPDEQGVTIRYVSPSGGGLGTKASPYSSIQTAVNSAQPGDKIKIASGTYKEKVTLTHGGTAAAPITIEASGSATITGSEPANVTWSQIQSSSTKIFTADWTGKLSNQQTGTGYTETVPGYVGHPDDWRYCDLIVVDDRMLVLVDNAASLKEWTFYIDRPTKQIRICLPSYVDINTCKIEYGVNERSTLFTYSGDVQYVNLKGLRFTYSANTCDEPMVRIGSHWRIEDCVIDGSNGLGLRADISVYAYPYDASSNVVRCQSVRHGGLSVAASGYHVNFEDCDFGLSNWKGYNPDYGTSNKAFAVGYISFLNCRSYWNCGPGIWFDMTRHVLRVQDCEIFGNFGGFSGASAPGVFVEATYGPTMILNNDIYSNTGDGVSVAESGGYLDRPSGAVTTSYNDGQTSGPMGVTVSGNKLAMNAQPFSIRLIRDAKAPNQENDPNAPFLGRADAAGGWPHIVQNVSFISNIVYRPYSAASFYSGSAAATFVSQDLEYGQSSYFHLDLAHLQQRAVSIDLNTYEQSYFSEFQSPHLAKFAHAYGFPPPVDQAYTFAQAQQLLGFEQTPPPSGRTITAAFPRFTVPSFPRSSAPAPVPFSSVITASSGTGNYILPVFHRAPLNNSGPLSDQCTLYDVHDNPLVVSGLTVEAQNMVRHIPTLPLSYPVYLKVFYSGASNPITLVRED